MNNPDWCPGCGNFIILAALKKAIKNLKLKKENIVITSGIGCSSKLPQYIDVFGLHGLHGRGIPMAQGIKMANKKLKIIVIGGDGDVYGEGINHFISAIRDDTDITLLVHNNFNYALTKGQDSPTTDGSLKPVSLALSQDCGFVARSTTAHMAHLTDIITKAIQYNGFSFVDILQECVIYNKKQNTKWYRENTCLLKNNINGKIPIGIFSNKKKKRFSIKSKTKPFKEIIVDLKY